MFPYFLLRTNQPTNQPTFWIIEAPCRSLKRSISLGKYLCNQSYYLYIMIVVVGGCVFFSFWLVENLQCQCLKTFDSTNLFKIRPWPHKIVHSLNWASDVVVYAIFIKFEEKKLIRELKTTPQKIHEHLCMCTQKHTWAGPTGYKTGQLKT